MCDEQMCQSMGEILTRFLTFHFENQNSKFEKCSDLFAQIIVALRENPSPNCQENFNSLMEWCIEEGYENNMD